ncbi:signal transduction protein [Candidatus Magnetobacterium bavaricum]|uniref:Signal transduction protein n=1 Tax=Candidatus Magnetobacterium bavaricum TaxID=29290 RepID=A0A0F3GRH7_9BACT|nr:signal transduction protein [Candidatus Magnetobacterium bavaricum]
MTGSMTVKQIPIVVRLLDIINAHREFPAMSRTITLVSEQTAAGSDASVTELTNTILDDFALSNKLLRMVNTAAYIKYHGAGRITTVSRAVYILGFHHVRDAALSLLLFEQIKNKSLALELRESFVMSFMSGVIAKEIGKKLGVKDVEEAFICSMFHDLGKLLTRFYLPDEQRKIKDLAVTQGATEDEIAPSVVNASYDTIGMEVAKHWNFSDNIVHCMQKLPMYKLTKPKTELETLRCLVLFANKLCELINKTTPNSEEWKKALETFKHRFDTCFTSYDKMICEVLEGSFKEVKAYCDNFNLSMGHSHFLQNLESVVKGPQETPGKGKKHLDAGAKSPMQILDGLLDNEDESSEILTPEDVLAKGILEIANALLESFSLNDILRMILEVLYRGMEFTRVVISIRSPKEPYMEGRFGFGQRIEKLVKGFRFQVDKTSDDVFNISLSRDSIVLINNVHDVEVQSCIPTWLRTVFNANTFIVIPITLRKAPIALIYGDWISVDPKALHPKRLRYVKTLRNQAMLAIKHSM